MHTPSGILGVAVEEGNKATNPNNASKFLKVFCFFMIAIQTDQVNCFFNDIMCTEITL